MAGINMSDLESDSGPEHLPYGEILEKLPLIRELLSVISRSDDKEEVDICVEKLCEAFRKEGLETDAVMDEIEQWLWYLTGQSQTDKKIDRCLWFFVKCGLRMLLQDTVTPRLFTLLIEHIKNIQFAAYDPTRFRCCQMIALIFEGIEEIEADYEPTESGDEAILPAEVKRTLVKVLQERRYDKNPTVRAQVIRSLSILCRISDNGNDDETGFDCTEHILKSLRDVSRDVRTEAVRSVPLLSEHEISTFISTLLEETDNNVRRLAFGRIACNLHVRSFTLQQRMQLLKASFAGDDAVLRKIAERMVAHWAGNELVPLFNLLQHLDFVTDPETSQQALTAFLKNYQREVGCTRASEMLVNLRELCSAAQAESATTTDSSARSNFLTCDMIDRRNYVEVCRSNEFYVVAGRIFLWRCLCEYCRENAIDEGDRSESLHFLLPDMIHFVDFLYKGKWQIALETIISTRDLPNSIMVLEFAVYELFDLFYAEKDELEQFLEWCCYRLNSFFTPDLNETEELPLTRALLVKRGKEHAMLQEITNENDNKYEPERHNIQRALLLLRTIMRNPNIAKVTTFLRAAFDQVIDANCTSLDPMIWVTLCEVIGIGVAIDERIARERIHMLRSAIEVEGAPTRVKELALMAVAACAISRSYVATAQLYYPEVLAETGMLKGQMLLGVFEGFIFNKEEDLSFAAVESIGRMLYYGCHNFPSALAGCLLRYFDKTCPGRPYAFLKYFFEFYPSSDSINQHKLVGALRHALKRLREAEDSDNSLASIDASKMVNFVAKAVRKVALSSSSKNEELEETYPPQFFLINCLLDWVINNDNENLNAACIGALTCTSPEEFSDIAKAHLYLLKQTARCINVLFTQELDKLIPMVRRFERRLAFSEDGENIRKTAEPDVKIKMEVKGEAEIME